MHTEAETTRNGTTSHRLRKLIILLMHTTLWNPVYVSALVRTLKRASSGQPDLHYFNASSAFACGRVHWRTFADLNDLLFLLTHGFCFKHETYPTSLEREEGCINIRHVRENAAFTHPIFLLKNRGVLCLRWIPKHIRLAFYKISHTRDVKNCFWCILLISKLA